MLLTTKSIELSVINKKNMELRTLNPDGQVHNKEPKPLSYTSHFCNDVVLFF